MHLVTHDSALWQWQVRQDLPTRMPVMIPGRTGKVVQIVQTMDLVPGSNFASEYVWLLDGWGTSKLRNYRRPMLLIVAEGDLSIEVCRIDPSDGRIWRSEEPLLKGNCIRLETNQYWRIMNATSGCAVMAVYEPAAALPKWQELNYSKEEFRDGVDNFNDREFRRLNAFNPYHPDPRGGLGHCPLP